MNDENIKEILDNIKNKYEDYYVQDIVSGNDLKQLLDYITNLQQDNEMYAQLKDEYEEEIKDLQQIEQEHKKLNAELRQENSNLKTSLDEAQEVLSEYKEENERLKHQLKAQEDLTIKNRMRKHIYKSRCEKASEYIKEHQRKDEFLNLNEWQSRDLLNILQNGSDSQ